MCKGQDCVAPLFMATAISYLEGKHDRLSVRRSIARFALGQPAGHLWLSPIPTPHFYWSCHWLLAQSLASIGQPERFTCTVYPLFSDGQTPQT